MGGQHDEMDGMSSSACSRMRRHSSTPSIFGITQSETTSARLVLGDDLQRLLAVGPRRSCSPVAASSSTIFLQNQRIVFDDENLAGAGAMARLRGGGAGVRLPLRQRARHRRASAIASGQDLLLGAEKCVHHFRIEMAAAVLAG